MALSSGNHLGSSVGLGRSATETFPLVGRAEELAALEALLEDAPGATSVAWISGDGGSGKTRLADEIASRAARRGWALARGGAYPVEQGVPFALFSDAFLPLLREMDPSTLAVLSRGGEAELRNLFPALGPGTEGTQASGFGDPDELRTRLFWNFGQFLKSYAKRTPLLVVLEDLHWADASSLELLHFVARQSGGSPLLFLCTYDSTERDGSPHLVRVERSLLSLGTAQVLELAPLTLQQVTELVCRVLSVNENVVREFAAVLFGWTRGNTFFVEETLRALVARGTLRWEKGTWVGWDARDFALPSSIRDAVTTKLAAFSKDARSVADLAAVVGTRTSYPLLRSISGLGESELLGALEELVGHGVLAEQPEKGAVVYDFRHPVVRDTLYREFGLQRARVLHGAVAEAMEAFFGDAAMEHADELAYHFSRTDAATLTPKAVTYLTAAGVRARARHADREAIGYLGAALDRVGSVSGGEDGPSRQHILENLARAHLRLGDYETAASLWKGAADGVAEGTSEHASLMRNLGMATFWCGSHQDALAHLEEGVRSATAAGDVAALVRLRLVRGHCLQELGKGREALADVEAALPQAEALGDAALSGRVYRSLAQLSVWLGSGEAAERYARTAIELAQEVGDLTVEFWARYHLAVLWGMTGDTAAMAEAIGEARELAERLRSPVLRIWTSEMAIELAYATGDWDSGVTIGEQSISLARALNQSTLLPRVLLVTSLFHTGRGDADRAKALVDEACAVAGVDGTDDEIDVHRVVPTYTGLAHYLLGIGDHAGAIRAARKGLEAGEGTGYDLWFLHRLLPVLAEACLWVGDIDEAERVGTRMREHATRMNHTLGLAWADACDALVRWKRGDLETGARDMRAAAEKLEEIPMVPDAVRMRRQLAGRLAELGDTEGSDAELRRVHDVLARLGAHQELEKARLQFEEIGHRPPPWGTGKGLMGLTARELQVARLVGQRKSNKAVGRELDIAERTVSTHLSNINKKLGVKNRIELGDLLRDEGLLED